MAAPAIIWRNPKTVERRRLWNQARHDDNRRVYVVVRSGIGDEGDWEGLPNLIVIDGGATSRTRAGVPYPRMTSPIA